MENPFLNQAKPVFIERQHELDTLCSHLKRKISIILVSPRGWGKSTLAELTAKYLKSNENLKIRIYRDSRSLHALMDHPGQNRHPSLTIIHKNDLGFRNHPRIQRGLSPGLRYLQLHLPRAHDFQDFIREQFGNTHKCIDEKACLAISIHSANIPFYIQLLCWHCWQISDNECSVHDVTQAWNNLKTQFHMHFYAITQSLSERQKRLLLAIGHNLGQPYAAESIRDFGLGSKGHVAGIAASLIKQGIIVRTTYTHTFNNPIYKDWFLRDFRD